MKEKDNKKKWNKANKNMSDKYSQVDMHLHRFQS